MGGTEYTQPHNTHLVREPSDAVASHDKKLCEVPGDVSGHPRSSLQPREQRVRPESVDVYLPGKTRDKRQ